MSGPRFRAVSHVAAVSVAVVVGVGVSTASVSAPVGATGRRGAPPPGVIKHVVVLFQENRSFDEVLGAYCQTRAQPCDGDTGPVTLSDGSVVPLTPSPDMINPDPPHTVTAQTTAVDGGRMDGWGKLGSGCTSPGTNNCLTYYSPSQVPSLTTIADHFVVSDHTFSAQNSPSWGGHIWPAAATQDGFTGDIPQATTPVSGPLSWGCDSKRIAKWINPQGKLSWQPSCIPAPNGFLDPVQYPYKGAFEATQVKSVPTIFDRLVAAHLTFRIYSSVYSWAVCPTFARCLYGPQHTKVVPPAQFLTDTKKGTLPSYSLLMPTGPNGTGQHPPSSMLVGDNWIGTIVNALEASPEWSSTALFITYDDCGCFYDHVPPGVNPDGTVQGIRVPMVIVSPYAKVGATDSTPATFASFVKFTEEAFALAPLNVNDAQAYDYSNSFDFSQPPSKPRVRPRMQKISQATLRAVAALPPDDNDPT